MAKLKHKQKTKLAKLLKERGLDAKAFAELVYEETNFLIAVQNLYPILNGKIKNYMIDKAKAFSKALGVTIEEVIEDKL